MAWWPDRWDLEKCGGKRHPKSSKRAASPKNSGLVVWAGASWWPGCRQAWWACLSLPFVGSIEEVKSSPLFEYVRIKKQPTGPIPCVFGRESSICSEQILKLVWRTFRHELVDEIIDISSRTIAFCLQNSEFRCQQLHAIPTIKTHYASYALRLLCFLQCLLCWCRSLRQSQTGFRPTSLHSSQSGKPTARAIWPGKAQSSRRRSCFQTSSIKYIKRIQRFIVKLRTAAENEAFALLQPSQVRRFTAHVGQAGSMWSHLHQRGQCSLAHLEPTMRRPCTVRPIGWSKSTT